MATIVVATANQGKIKEILEIFTGSGYELKFLNDFSAELAGIEIQENAKTFEGNALIKALVIGEALGLPTLADDSGLCVDYLDGAPGVLTARYSPEKTDLANYTKLLREMADVPAEQRGCHYNCTVAIYDPRTKFVETVAGEWYGRLAEAPRGDKSFGYAPVFLSADHGYELTNAELEVEQTIGINHRGKAFRAALKILDKYLSD